MIAVLSRAGRRRVDHVPVFGPSVEHRGTMRLENLPAQDLGEQVRRVLVGRDVVHFDHASAAQLTHLEHFAVHMGHGESFAR